ncbi:phage protein [Bacillus thuringiensis]|uniref:Phage protein n=1 Tax=Bacillus thuringiensis TaxID=1428 RepID=A0A9W3S895_BACTU|nr:hypothetical protein [Bacillus thuringiensis]ANS46768.1 phage protein [Bacillus thuringiensis]ANS51256.1 phage protein [Bacillus thuringiensis]MBH0337346.1 phage protein [Bacillus thuringiensis]MBH0337780.1 phage protein [Bacillus thuringiensis]MBH0340127.1 phage protein [Bacillus thuringiensis]
MQISFEQLRSLMKKSGIPVSRDCAPTGVDYPYIVYEFVNEQQIWASNKVLQSMPLYQIAVITNGTEKDYEPLKVVFHEAGVSYSQFESYPYDENDDTITQFITNVRCMQ